METSFTVQPVETNGIRLSTIQAGPDDGPLVLLLHGFPEHGESWSAQIAALAGAGYRVWAPDLRGYGRSDKPTGVAAYGVATLVADIVGLIDAAGVAKAHAVVGHDWGGVLTWRFGATAPERTERLVVLNAPHGAVMRRHLKENPAQRKRSRYMAMFQLPRLPEWLLGRADGKALARSLRRSSNPGTFSAEKLASLRDSWRRPGALTAMVAYYRALRQAPGAPPTNPRITPPLLLIWGMKDTFLGPELAPDSLAMCDHGQLVTLDDATHWLHHEHPDRINALLLDFLSTESNGQAARSS